MAQFGAVFEEYFATPQEVDFARLCAAHGVGHVHVEDWSHFDGPRVGRFRPAESASSRCAADRKRDAAWRKEAFASAAAPAIVTEETSHEAQLEDRGDLF